MTREIRFESIEAFFKRGREIARRADRGEPIAPSRILSFEPGQLARVVSPARLKVLAALRQSRPLSITALANHLGRDRAAVKRDVDILVEAGFLRTKSVPLAGHGRQTLVEPVARRMMLVAEV